MDVLIPTFTRPDALAVTLSGLAAQEHRAFRVVVSDQSPRPVQDHPLVLAMTRVLGQHGIPTEFDHHLPRRGVAENRQHLLELADAPLVLCLDDDVWLEPWALHRLQTAIDDIRCGFVGFAVQGLS